MADASAGDPRPGARAIAERAALVPRRERTCVVVEGRDRLDFLHRVTTQDLKTMPVGVARPLCVLDPRGRVLGDPVAWNLGDRVLLEMSRAAAVGVLPALERFLITEDVTLRDASDSSFRATLAGPLAAGLLSFSGLPAPSHWQVGEGSIPGVPVRILRRDLGRIPCFELLAFRNDAPRLIARFTDSPDLLIAGEGSLDTVRVEEGVPAFGSEADGRVLPTEAGLWEAVSWTKGCYPGQEPVVMARHRGHPAHLLGRLWFDRSDPPGAGTALLEEGRPAGRVTSAVRGVNRRGIVGLGLVRYALAKAGTVLEVEGGGLAKVEEVRAGP